MYKLGGVSLDQAEWKDFSPQNILPGFKKFMVGSPDKYIGPASKGYMIPGTKGILGAAGKLFSMESYDCSIFNSIHRNRNG